MRIQFIRVMVLLLFMVIGLHLFYLQVVRGRYFYQLSRQNRIRLISTDAPRGRILDRNGLVLADNRRVFNVILVPQDIKNQPEVFSFLSGILKKKQTDITKSYRNKLITPFTPIVMAEDISRSTAVLIEESRFQYPGVMIEESFLRTYPYAEAGGHLIGYVGKVNPDEMTHLQNYGMGPMNWVGRFGVEKSYDEFLHGEAGGRQIEINSRGKQVRLLGFKNSIKGKDVTLTIDQEIQNIAYGLLQGYRGAIILMDAANGEILSLVSSPAYDPNAFTDRGLRQRGVEYIHDTNGPLLNRAINGRFPPGSVFKIPVAIAGLETGKTTLGSTYHCLGSFELGNLRFGCTHVHEDENLIQAIAHSCNVYFYHIGLKITARYIESYARLLGFGKKTGIDLPFEEAGHIPSRTFPGKRRWYGGDTVNLSIGQGDVLATPIQLVQLMATVANEGRVMHPHVIKAIDGKEIVALVKQQQLPIKKRNWQAIERGLSATITDSAGTAHDLNSFGLKIFGKTGTAQAGRDKEHHAWFAGYFEASEKKYAFCIFLEHGGSSHNAVLMTKEFISQLQEIDFF